MALMQSNPEALPRSAIAPEFTLKNAATGTDVSLTDFKGTPIAVIFMCNHCPYVIPKMDEIRKLQDTFGEKIPLVCINPNNNPAYEEDDWEHSVALAKKLGYTYYLFDETQEVAKAYGAVCTPDVFVFDAEHHLVYHGRINDDVGTSNTPKQHDVQDVLTAVSNEEEIEDWFRPSQGCSIKWNQRD